MRVDEIYNRLNEIKIFNDGYSVFDTENLNSYFGRDNKNNTVFMMDSSSPNKLPICQETKTLKLLTNKKVKIRDSRHNIYYKTVHIL